MKALFALLLFVFAVLLGLREFRAPVWTPDGLIYSEMMLSDRGVSREAAREQATAFYLSSTEIGQDPRYRPYFLNERLGMFTPIAKPFASRILYPLVAAPFFPWLGFKALPFISLLAFVAATLTVYRLLLGLCRPPIAVLGASLFAISPVIGAMSAAALTDMLALLFLAAALDCTIRYAVSGRTPYIWFTAVWIVLLVLTRPLSYVPLCAALAFAVWALTERSAVHLRRAAGLSLVALGGWALYALVSSVTRTPGLGVHLHWLYDAAKTHWLYSRERVLSPAERASFSTWYVTQIAWAAKAFAALIIRSVYPLAAVVLCAIGLYRERRSPASALLGGFIIGCCVGILANPIALELPRLVEAPASIAVIAGVALFVESSLRPTRRIYDDAADRLHQRSG